MRRVLLTLVSFLLMFGEVARAEPQWMKFPPTPSLPSSINSGYAQINGVKIWYAVFGKGQPVILLHGGLSNSDYWGNLVPIAATDYQVIVMDSRAHGRSSHNNKPLVYDRGAVWCVSYNLCSILIL
jgi:alpha-beta hydrolase superfamily lysophospholipase